MYREIVILLNIFFSALRSRLVKPPSFVGYFLNETAGAICVAVSAALTNELAIIIM